MGAQASVVRMLAMLVLLALGIRLVFELLAPVIPWILLGLVGYTIARVFRWYRGRW